jgi:VWFA-related protein
MNKPWPIWIALPGLLCLTAPGQTTNPHQIVLDVVVTDKAGKPVPGLQEQDFTLLDNKKPQKLTSFRAVEGSNTDLPVKLILVIDEINESFVNVSAERERIGKFLQADGGKLPLPTTLMVASDSGTSASSAATQDGNALFAQLTSEKTAIRTNSQAGAYGAMDRITLSLRAIQQLLQKEASQPGRKLVVWISPGWSLLSSQEMNLGNDARQKIFNTIVELSYYLRESRITLYNVDPSRTVDTRTAFLYQSFLKGQNNSKQTEFGHVALQVLAEQTGGRVLLSSNDLGAEINKCISDAQAFYVLSFQAAPPDEVNAYHAIEVKLDKPGLSARTRTGYYTLTVKPKGADSPSRKAH